MLDKQLIAQHDLADLLCIPLYVVFIIVRMHSVWNERTNMAGLAQTRSHVLRFYVILILDSQLMYTLHALQRAVRQAVYASDTGQKRANLHNH